MNSLINDVALSVSGIPLALAVKLLEYFDTPTAIYNATDNELIEKGEIRPRELFKLRDTEHFERAKAVISEAEAKNIRIIPFYSPLYPPLLRQCSDAPVVLYGLGCVEALEDLQHCVAVVGTRKNTTYGGMATQKIISELAKHYPQTVVVSGLAYGIDAIAHKCALKEGLKTVAVLAHGLDTIYPSSHRSLAIDIVRSGGILLTEYPLRTTVFKQNFLQRNRIVAGMCCATVVSEAPLRSGSLATANLAHGYNRQVFAFPGRVSDESFSGNNQMIFTQKATLLRSLEDIEYIMDWNREKKRENSDESREAMTPADMTDNQTLVYQVLSDGEEHYDEELSEVTGLPMSELGELLMVMEIRDLIVALPGRLYIKR